MAESTFVKERKYYKKYFSFLIIFLLFALREFAILGPFRYPIDYIRSNIFTGQYGEEVAILIVGVLGGLFLYKILDYDNKIKAKIAGKGREFERTIASYFTEYGYKVEMPTRGKDYGADLLVEFEGVKKVIQVKYRDKNKVGLKSVQEVNAAKEKYNATQGVVITNKDFTKEAKSLAKDTNVKLLRGVDYEGIIKSQQV